jgi:hypothetical protein
MMTRTGRKKNVDSDFWKGRLGVAHAFKKSAADALTMAETGMDANPIISNVVLAAIAYVDCLTAKRANVVNQQDHSAALQLLRDVLGAALPTTQVDRIRRILGYKDASQYGARPATVDQAQRLFNDLVELANWVELQI